jgi:acetyl esterase/lipase
MLALSLPLFAQQASKSPPGPSRTASLLPPGVAGPEDVIFGKGGSRNLHAEIYYPRNLKKPMPAILFLHSGGWVAGSHRGAPVAFLAADGYFVASIEYRLSFMAEWPAQLDDCRTAVRWLRANAEKYNIDPNRIGVWGESAGGHLADCLATMPPDDDDANTGVSSAVQAVVTFYAPTDFTHPKVFNPATLGMIFGLLGSTYDQDPALWKNASPITYVKAGDPPTLLVHGDKDSVIPPEQTTVYAAALEKAGVPHKVIMVKNADHLFLFLPGKPIQPSQKEILQAVADFFDKYLKAP